MSRRANQHIALLNEEFTRILIDQNLNDAGWFADSQELAWPNGTRSETRIDKAVVEWPTEQQGKKGRADYVMFCSLTPPVGVEAKENADVAGKILQAELYSKGFKITSPMIGAWEQEGRTIAWADEAGEHYIIPFVYF